MRKIIKKISAVLMVAISCLLISCNGLTPELDISKARKNLKENDYYVEKNNEMLNDEWSMEEILYASDDDENFIVIIEFDSVKSAKTYYKTYVREKQEKNALKFYEYIIKNYSEELDKEDLDDFKEEKKEAEEYLEKNSNGVQGKYVWFGTKDAIEDTKG